MRLALCCMCLSDAGREQPIGVGGGLWGARGSPYPAGHPSSLCPLPEKSQRASILGPTGIATLQPSGNNPEARFPHIQDTAARLLSPDEVTAVLRHCSRVRHCGQSAGRAQAEHGRAVLAPWALPATQGTRQSVLHARFKLWEVN